MRIARYYRGARTAHLERLHRAVPGDFLYMKAMYDFDVTQAPEGQVVRRVGMRQVLSAVWNSAYDIVEIVEPYAPSALPQNVAIALVHRMARVLRRSDAELVAYAIENADLIEKFAAQFRVPRRVVRGPLRAAVGLCYGVLARIAFGTEDAERNYRSLLGARRWDRSAPRRTVIAGLSSPRDDASLVLPERRSIVFLGAFDERKGLRELVAAWPLVIARVPDAELLIMGKGPLVEWVRERALELPNVILLEDPERDRIWPALSGARALFLLSQPAPGWKEQIGLPILEGLSLGLEIIASTETGIADWLERHGHHVLPPSASAEEIAGAVARAVTSTRPREVILSALPKTDGRIVADAWLHGSGANR